MGVVEWLTPRIGPLSEPAGEPGALRDAARAYTAASDAMDTHAGRIRQAQASVVSNGWYGIAALAFAGDCSRVAADCAVGGNAFRTAAAALTQYAAELEAARELARRAQAAAAEVNAASDRLDSAYAEAQAAERAAAASAKPQTGPSPIPGLVAQAAGLRLQALAIGAQAAQAEEQATTASARAAAAFEQVAAMAPSVRRAAVARAAAEAEAAKKEDEGGILGVLRTAAKPFVWAGEQAADFGEGAWDSVKDPAVMIYRLTPFNDSWQEQWQQLGSGIKYGVTHPGEFAKAFFAVDALEERGFAYWAGNLAPSMAAAFFTGGGSAGLRAASGTARVAENAGDVAGAARKLDRAADAADAAGDASRAAGAAGASRSLDKIDELASAAGGGGTIHDYSKGLIDDLDDFRRGSASFHTGPLDDDLVLVQYFDIDKPGKSSMRYWTSTSQANELPTMQDVHQRLALLPEWGPRSGVRVARIPEGTDVSFLYGRARRQVSETGEVFEGGGEQFRFVEFDERWIVETRRLP